MMAMTAWTSDELNRIGSAQEMQIAAVRGNGSLRKPVIVWVVRSGDDMYTRSVHGRDAAWFRGTQIRHEGHIEAGGVDKDVTFVDVDGDVNDEIDAAYRTKYRSYAGVVPHIVSPQARAATLKLLPR